ncbi:MAG: hemerythrin domain-containing protein [Myxococcales bacterium]
MTVENASARSLTEFLERDHRRLDRLLEEALSLAERRANIEAASRAAEFKAGLERHIRWEEEILFPLFEERLGSPQGPTRVMRAEHEELLRLLRGWTGSSPGQVAEAFVSSSNALAALLSQHNMKEEHILYPQTDAALDDAEREAAILRMERLDSNRP